MHSRWWIAAGRGQRALIGGTQLEARDRARARMAHLVSGDDGARLSLWQLQLGSRTVDPTGKDCDWEMNVRALGQRHLVFTEQQKGAIYVDANSMTDSRTTIVDMATGGRRRIKLEDNRASAQPVQIACGRDFTLALFRRANCESIVQRYVAQNELDIDMSVVHDSSTRSNAETQQDQSDPIASIHTMLDSYLLRTESGRLSGAGWSFDGQLATASTPNDPHVDHLLLRDVPMHHGIGRLFTGSDHAVAVAMDGKALLCWGNNEYGQCDAGDGVDDMVTDTEGETGVDDVDDAFHLFTIMVHPANGTRSAHLQ